MERSRIGSWLEGPPVPDASDEGRYRGERLGLPEHGPGSLASPMRRVAAIAADWVIALLISGLFTKHVLTGGQLVPLGVLAADYLLLGTTVGATVGMRLFGIRIAAIDGGRAAPSQVFLRTLGLFLVIPVAIWDRDTRGMHDRWSSTMVVATR